jgi:hypothetical protein
MDLWERGWKGMNLIHLAQEPVMGSSEHSNEHPGSIKGWEFLE